MMIQEFIALTGFEPTPAEYRVIEEDYYNFNGDKEAFCRKFVQEGHIAVIANARQRRQLAEIQELKKETVSQTKEIGLLQNQVRKLQKALDRELDWKPVKGVGTNLSQERYEKLRDAAGTESLSYEKALKLIHREFGFDPAMVEIEQIVCTYEANKYKRLRPSEEYRRKPLYNSSDWNYIRFDCGGYCYEMINGELEKYCC